MSRTTRSTAAAMLTMFIATAAAALPSEVSAPVLRYATEPSTGSMVLATLVVIAVVRRGRGPFPWTAR